MSKTIEEKYQKKDLHQHILDRPDTYIGSNKVILDEQFVFDEKQNRIIKKTVNYNPSFIKIFDEILVNAIDHSVVDSSMNFIKVNIDRENNTIEVHNNGKGIPIVKHAEYEVYIPEMIFGELLTSSNYDDTDKRVVGGRNGMGAKATAIYSTFFAVETVDEERGLYYYQEFTNNMYDKSKPKIKKTNTKSYTKIKFKPDYSRFKLKGITDDINSILVKRVYDSTACTDKRVAVYLNGKKIKEKDFLNYIQLYLDNSCKIIYESSEGSWEYAVTMYENYSQVSFVNGIATTQGGKHVDYILNQIVKKLSELIKTRKKIDNIKPNYIKDRLFIFVKSTIVNPNFSSQSKELLTTPVKDFGFKVEVSDNFIMKLYKSGIVEDIISFTKYKNDKELKKAEVNTSKKKNLHIANLEDAHNAGTSKSNQCTLILTEGLSAKTFAMSGLAIIGRNNFGVSALRGKLLNVREATQKQLLENEEINNLKKILGLQHGVKYKDVNNLRYGRVCILTDSDVDGVHIRCLIVNMFHAWWPELLDIKGFIVSMRTPIVKITNNRTKIQKPFYSIKDYTDWAAENQINLWTVKYYKGLGTSTANEAKEIFKEMDESIVNYISTSKDNTDNAIILAFDKKQADLRKAWLQNYNFEKRLDQENHEFVKYEDLINKELIHFSIYDVIRSIPCICDGLKPSQRKVMYTLFKKNYKKEIKVAQLGASVAETTSYHHGENSLYSTIVNMAQDYAGSNNINLLKPNGQFGCLDPNTFVRMWDKSIKKAKYIKENDKLMGDDSTSRTVLKTVSGNDKMYLINLNNGLKYTVNQQHILTLYKSSLGVVDIYLKDYIALSKEEQDCYKSIVKCYKNEKIDEYVDFSVTFKGVWEFNGWQLDKNERFLLANGVVTHNSRLENGKDAASPRYIYTELNDITKKIFNPIDLNIVSYQEEEGETIEPVFYIPVLPMMLINGSNGIGTGYSTNIPSYNPVDIINNMKLLAEGKKIKEMTPYYKNFKGKITKETTGNTPIFVMKGLYEIKNNKTIQILEIPVGISINDYKEHLEKLSSVEKYSIQTYINNSTEKKPEFDIIFLNASALEEFMKLDFMKILKLTKNISVNNLHLLDENGVIKKYKNSEEILKNFLRIRIKYNDKRKQYLVNIYSKDIKILENKIRFLEEIMDDKITIYRKTKKQIQSLLEEKEYDKIDNSYDYLTSLSIFSFSKETLDDFYKKLQNVTEKYKDIKSKSNVKILLDDLEDILK